VGVCEVLAPHGGDDEQRGCRIESQEVVQQLHTRRVAPLRVVGDEQHRLTPAQGDPSGGVEQPAPVLCIVRDRRPGRVIRVELG
jgi:hypothetical protein